MKLAAALLSLCFLCSVQSASYTLTLASGTTTQVVGPTLFYGGNAVVESNQATRGWVLPSSFPAAAAWIWDSPLPTNDKVPQECFFSLDFEVQGTITKASLRISADDDVQIALNGVAVQSITNAYWYIYVIDITSYVQPGLNTLNLGVINSHLGPAGLIYSLIVNYSF